MLDRFLFKAGNLHLRDTEDAGRALLRKAAVKAQRNHIPLPLRQRAYRFAQGKVFNKALLLRPVCEYLFECEALLPRLALQGFRGTNGSLGRRDICRLKAGLLREF